jgi:hypothetical protein
VWVDRVRRRGILIGADLGRGLLLLAVPGAALAGQLRIEELYVVEFLVGSLSLLFEVAYTAFVPSLVATDELQSANARLELSNRITQVGGPAAAGALVQLVSAPIAIAADAVSFLASAFLLSMVRGDEPERINASPGSNLLADLREGIRFVLASPVQRALVAAAGTYNLFGYMQASVLVLYVTRELGFSPALFGASLGAFGAGGVLGALTAARIAGVFGTGRAIVISIAVAASGDVLVALAGPPLPAFGLLVAGRFLAGVGLPLFVVNALSLRQAITPPALLGRTAATARWVTWGVLPVGALLGGVLGESLGLRGTLIVSALGSCLAVAWVALQGSNLATRFSSEACAHAPAAAGAN